MKVWNVWGLLVHCAIFLGNRVWIIMRSPGSKNKVLLLHTNNRLKLIINLINQKFYSKTASMRNLWKRLQTNFLLLQIRGKAIFKILIIKMNSVVSRTTWLMISIHHLDPLKLSKPQHLLKSFPPMLSEVSPRSPITLCQIRLLHLKRGMSFGSLPTN